MIPCRTLDFTEQLALQNGYSLKQASFFKRLQHDYPECKFKLGPKFVFKPRRTIIIGPSEPSAELLSLHELSHAICKHQNFSVDIMRLKMEAEAWEKARELASLYNVKFNEELAQQELDTYRDWLHQKSRCPICGLTRFQTPDSKYHCPGCESFN